MTTTKALKAKPTRRAAKTAKLQATAYSRRVCEVAQIGRDYDVLGHARRYYYRRWDKLDAEGKKRVGAIIDAIDGTMRGHIERASQVQAYSPEGVCFQIMLCYGEAAAIEKIMGDKGDSFRHFDRIRRLCHSATKFFENAMKIQPARVGELELMHPGDDPRHLTRWSVKKYQEYLASDKPDVEI